MTDQERNKLVEQILESGYLTKYWQKYMRQWMDVEQFHADLMLATVKASRRYDPSKGTWTTYAFWYWRSVRTEYHRLYKRDCKTRKLSLSNLEFDFPDIPGKRFSFSASQLEKLIDNLSDRDRFYLLGCSNQELGRRKLTRSAYEIERRRVRRRLLKEL